MTTAEMDAITDEFVAWETAEIAHEAWIATETPYEAAYGPRVTSLPEPV